MDMALIAQAATLEARIPFLHFFDGFRTSHEVAKIEQLDRGRHARHDRRRPGRGAPRPRPVARTTPSSAAPPRTRTSTSRPARPCNPFYLACPAIVQNAMDKFAALTGRQYHLFDYVGAPDAERVDRPDGLRRRDRAGDGRVPDRPGREGRRAQGPPVPARSRSSTSSRPCPRRSRPSPCSTAPRNRARAGEPLYLDVVTALAEAVADGAAPFARMPRVIGGRYGLSSKEFTPAMVKAVFDELSKAKPKNHFTVGINDDVTHTSLAYDPHFSTEDPTTVRALFYGLGADGTVGANKNSIKIIGEETDNYAQGYFVYDSKKSGSVTVSHLRFGPQPIRSTYLISQANFVACHQFTFLERLDMLKRRRAGRDVPAQQPVRPGRGLGPPAARRCSSRSSTRSCKFYVIDAYKVATKTGMGGRINTIMQTCFFAISGVLPRDEAIAADQARHREDLRQARRGGRAEELRRRRRTPWPTCTRSRCPAAVTSTHRPAAAGARRGARRSSRTSLAPIIAGDGDGLPVSAMPGRRHLPDRHHPVGEAQHRPGDPGLGPRRSASSAASASLVCPHAAIRAKVYDPALLAGAPADLQVGAGPLEGVQGPEVHAAGRARGLHRLRAVRRGLPGQEQDRGQAQGHQHGAAAAAPRDRSAPTGTSS